MRLAGLLALVLLAPLAFAAPNGGHALATWTYGSVDELTPHTLTVTPDGLRHEPIVFAEFEVPPEAGGVYAKLTEERIGGARVGLSFGIRLLAPSGAEWVVAGTSTLAVAHCPDLSVECAHESGDSPHAQSTPLLANAPGVWRLLAYGSTNGEWDVTVFTT